MQHTAPEWGGQWSVEFIAAARLRECFSAPLHCHLSSTLAGQYEYCSIQLPNIFWKVLKSGMSAKWDNTYENLGLISISWYNLHQCASCLARPFLSSALVWVIGGWRWRALFPGPPCPPGAPWEADWIRGAPIPPTTNISPTSLYTLTQYLLWPTLLSRCTDIPPRISFIKELVSGQICKYPPPLTKLKVPFNKLGLSLMKILLKLFCSWWVWIEQSVVFFLPWRGARPCRHSS